MDGFFTLKTFLRLLAAAVVLAAAILLISERIENSHTVQTVRQVEVTRIVQQTVLVTSVVEKAITTTPQPTKLVPTCPQIAVLPTLTPTPKSLAVMEDGVSIWCQPATSYDPNTILAQGQPPQDAIIAGRVDNKLTVTTQVKSCTFRVKFNDEFPRGARLTIQDLGAQPFLDLKLNPVEGDSSLAYVTTDHYFVIDPPYWNIAYFVSVYAPDGAKLWEEAVVFRREWIPEPCPNGLLPDINTLNCE